jgi:hypothetical protein
VWFARGERPSQEALRAMASNVATYLRDQLQELGKDKPDKGTLRERISQALQDLPGNLRPDRVPGEERGVGTAELEEEAQAPETKPAWRVYEPGQD